MSLSSDEVIKRAIVDILGVTQGSLTLRIFPQSSTDDQRLFADGGLTFGCNGVSYGSCDACWYTNKQWIDMYNGKTIPQTPVIAIEGTDALNRRSSGNAQYQRFHHALGAVKSGIIGVYYLKKGIEKIRPDLFGMAYFASQVEPGFYLIVDDLKIIADLLALYEEPKKLRSYIENYMNYMHSIFDLEFQKQYGGSWTKFAKKRSTIIRADGVIKYAARMLRNFTDSSQRAGHIAVGEMYLTKYYFNNKKFYYLFLKMTREDLEFLDKHKSDDKEWYLLRHEPNVAIKTIDDIIGLHPAIRNKLLKIKDIPVIGGEGRKIYDECKSVIHDGLERGELDITK